MSCDKAPNKVVIIHGREIGAIKTVSNEISTGLKEKKINHCFFNMSDYGSSMLEKVLRSYRSLKKLSRDNLYIFMHFDPMMVGLLLGLRGFKRKVNVIHTDLVEYYCALPWSRKIIFKIILFILRKDRFVFVSKESEIKAVEKFKLKNTKTIYNIYRFSNNEWIKNRFNEKTRLGSISRLHVVKNIDLLIRVFKKVKCTIPNAELLIYGSGDEQEKIEQYIKQQGCADFVKLLGPSNDKDAMYASIDAMVSFSSIEGLPTVILESVDHGVPVFYTDCSSGPRELMSPASDPLAKTASYEKTNVGYLVKPTKNTATYSPELDDYETEYVDIMLAFIDDLKNTRFSMEYDSKRFSREKITEQWKELINQFGNSYSE